MRYHNITSDDMLNGNGLRTVLWLSGCKHHCKECHNPSTWDETQGLIFDDEAKNELFGYLKKDYIDGITFSGGDPLHENNYKEVSKLIDEIKENFPDKTIWLYSGYTIEQLMEPEQKERLFVVKKCDVFVDGRYEKDKRNVDLHWVGSSNQKVIDVKNILMKQGEVIF